MLTFEAFLQSVRAGRTPYPWQNEFARRAAAGEAPDVISVPTGTGKTTAVDALVWALAAQAELAPSERSVGVRLVWAIDRRLLVDDVYRQANELAERLAEAWERHDASEPLFEVAARLQSLKFGGRGPVGEVVGPPLLVTRWRGGIATSPPAQHPLQAEVITSTIAQIGSRLLFRGYGLGAGSLPVGAALAACDTTICLDEAHLAEPFAQTVDAIVDRRAREPVLAPGLSVIRLSATAHDAGPRRTLMLGDADRAVLAQRLTAQKRARLIEPAGSADKDQEAALLAAIDHHLGQGATTLACVCNSVRIARSVFDRLAHAQPDADRMLLVGPQRPVDRTRMLAEPVTQPGQPADEGAPTRAQVLFGAERSPCPLVVVATQTFEVGLDADVEALVTQSASGAALVQRLGRLNRAGRHDGRASIVRHEEFPLYRMDEPGAWEWLGSLPTIDGEADVSVTTLLEHPPGPTRRVSRAPALTDMTVELLTQTSPGPHAFADPDVEAYLRGTDERPSSDVTLCWRADLCEDDFSPAADAYRDALLRLAPPAPEEQLTLSLVAARNLLRGQLRDGAANAGTLRRQVLDGADLEGDGPAEVAGRDDSVSEDHRLDGIPFFVRRGAELLKAHSPLAPDAGGLRLGDIRPGDLIVLPTAVGGVDEHGLAPGTRAATDVAADVAGVTAGPATVRLTGPALDLALRPEHDAPGPRAQRVAAILRRTAAIEGRLERARGDAGRDAAMADLLTTIDDHPAAAGLAGERLELRRLTPQLPPELTDPTDDVTGVLFDLVAPDEDEDDASEHGRGMALLSSEEEPMATSGWVLVPLRRNGDHESLRPRGEPPPTLEAHANAVAERAEAFALAAELPDPLVRTVRLAALAHDHGKADPRMQAFFHGGVAPPLAVPLAKSVFGTGDRQADRAARATSRLPVGLRHELASAQVLSQALDDPAVAGDADRDLALHLVVTHHGRARPIPPVPADGAPPRAFHVAAAGIAGTARGDGAEGWDGGASLRRATALAAQYGPWALAYLEAILVLADRTISAEGR